MNRDKENKKNIKHEKKDSGNGKDEDLLTPFEKMKKDLEKELKDGSLPEEKDLTKELETEEILEEIELLRKEVENYKKVEEVCIDRLKRLQADYDNYRKRTLKENLLHIKRANKDLIENLLPVIDNFEIALESGKKHNREKDEFYKGINMIYNKLIEILKKENVTIINPEGEEFDPKTCEAAITEAVEDSEEGKILEVLRKGYKIDDYLIRPAVVKVCKKD